MGRDSGVHYRTARMDMNSSNVSHNHYALAHEYFAYLAGRFPVMCASDEFHFLPRAEDAVHHYHALDSLSPDNIEEDISVLKDFQYKFRQAAAVRTNRNGEGATDLSLLTANAAGVLTELEGNQTWRHNPLLYLKIAFIGLDHALNKPAIDDDERWDRALSRLDQIPRLLDQGIANIQGIPESYHQAALDMVGDCRSYLVEDVSAGSGISAGRLQPVMEPALDALTRFNRFLQTEHPVPDKRFEAASIAVTLKDHFQCTRSLKEIFDIAVEEWNRHLAELKRLSRDIDGRATWQDLYSASLPDDVDSDDTFSMYGEEIRAICDFFRDAGLCETDYFQTMELKETPRYLRSVRSGASFGAGLTDDEKEKSYFYITTGGQGEEFDAQRKRRFHRELRYLVAHETVPGHHFLDSIRRGLANPVRRQIESALYYEGWASFAESLLFEYGYLHRPIDRLINSKRWLWRAARCQIDVGLPQGLITREDAVNLLTGGGFSSLEAVKQIDRFSLNPGYQLCYSLGSYEFEQIRTTYGPRFEKNDFYRHLLGGGELPFGIIEQRFNQLTSTQD